MSRRNDLQAVALTRILDALATGEPAPVSRSLAHRLWRHAAYPWVRATIPQIHPYTQRLYQLANPEGCYRLAFFPEVPDGR